MTIRAKNFALIDFSQQLVQRYFRVLADTELFVTMNVIKVKRSRMRVVPTYRAAALRFDFVYQVTTRLLKRLRYQFFSW